MVDGPLLFISYSSINTTIVDRLEIDLKRHGFVPWIDRGELKGGDQWLKRIEKAIDDCDAFIVVLSPDALKSEYVQLECQRARRKKKLMIPLHYLFCEDLPMVIEDKHIINFLKRNDEAFYNETYQKGFRQLLEALQSIPIDTKPVEKSDDPFNNDNKPTETLPSIFLPSFAPSQPQINKDNGTDSPMSPFAIGGRATQTNNSPIHNASNFRVDKDALNPFSPTPKLSMESVFPSGPTQASAPPQGTNIDTDDEYIIRPRHISTPLLPLTPHEIAPIRPILVPETQMQHSDKITRVAADAIVGATTDNPRYVSPSRIPPPDIPPEDPYRSSRLLFILIVLFIGLLLASTFITTYIQRQYPTITIAPDSQTVQDNYTLTGANTTSLTTREVAVRTITGTTQSASTQVKSTGLNQHPGLAASGHITFFNSSPTSRLIQAGTTIDIGNGVKLVTDTAINISAGNGFNNGHQTVSAHAEPPGRAGNIGADTLNDTPCCFSGISVSNDAFTDGQNAISDYFLQQSDVDNAISQSVKNVTKQNALNNLNKQLSTGEQFLNSPRCTPTLQADEPIGDQGKNVTSANVSYRMNCAATAYDNLGAQNIVKNLLTQKAATTPGPSYVLINNIQTTLSQTTTQNTLSFFFTGKGVWAYLFSDAQKLQLEKAIAGKTVAEAQNILKNTPGISNATINIKGGNTLPTGYNQISIVIQPIAGLGDGTPLPVVGSPTVTSPTVQSGMPGSNGKGGSAPPTAGGS